MRKLSLILSIFIIFNVMPLYAFQNGFYLEKIIKEHLPPFMKDSVEIKLYSVGGKGGTLSKIPYDVISGEKLKLNFNDGVLRGNDYHGKIFYDLVDDNISGELNLSQISINSTLLKKILLRVDMYPLNFRVYKGKINFLISTDKTRLEFNLKSNPYKLYGNISYDGKNIKGEFNFKYRYKYLPSDFYFAHILNDSLSERSLKIFFESDGIRETIFIPQEEEVKKIVYSILNGKGGRFRRLYGDNSLNPVLNSCSSILKNKKVIFKDMKRYYFNLINIELPNYLIITKNLPMYSGSFREYEKIDLKTFIEQVMFEYLNRKYMVNYNNYYIDIPPTIKKKLELSLFEDVKYEEIKNIDDSEKLVLLYFIYRNLLRFSRIKYYRKRLEKFSFFIQKVLLKLIRKDSSYRIMKFDREAERRIFYYSILYLILVDSLKKNGLKLILDSGNTPLILKSIVDKIDLKKLGEREKNILFYLKRTPQDIKSKLIFK